VAVPTVQRLLGQLRRMESSSLQVSLAAGVEHFATLNSLTADEKAEIAAYDRQVQAWNEACARYREAADARQQARKNAREVAAVRAAACPSCFATHAGDC
jgi:Zn finger protein HypA/HybF involved in hydrogenase expression